MSTWKKSPRGKCGDVTAYEEPLPILARLVDHLAHLVDDPLDVSRVCRHDIVLHKEQLDLSPIATPVKNEGSGSLRILAIIEDPNVIKKIPSSHTRALLHVARPFSVPLLTANRTRRTTRA